MGQPFKASNAKQIIRRILQDGSVVLDNPHLKDEMTKENPPLTAVDIVNVLRGGACDEAEWENGEWRHHVRTQRICVVVAIDENERELVVVTAWRMKP